MLPDPGTFIEYVVPGSGSRVVADAVTGLLLTPGEPGDSNARTVLLSPQALLLAAGLRDSPSHVPAFLQHVTTNFAGAPNPRRRMAANRVRKKLAAAPGAPHRIARLAADVGMSPFHLARVFRTETGLSVHQYLLRLRMASALERLRHAPTGISRLALDLGFSSHSHFTSVFRRQFGTDPSSVRADALRAAQEAAASLKRIVSS